MTDDFIVEEESSNRTFLYIAGGMGVFVVVGIIAIIIVALTRGGNGDNGNNEIAVMNQTIEAQNVLVTQTIEAMQTEAAYTPTPTPVPPTPLPTAIPSFTPTPAPPTFTPTSVAQTATPEVTLDEGGEGTGGQVGTPTAAGPTPTVGPGGGQLPAGGVGMWGAVLGAFVLLAVIVLARRLRPAV